MGEQKVIFDSGTLCEWVLNVPNDLQRVAVFLCTRFEHVLSRNHLN